MTRSRSAGAGEKWTPADVDAALESRSSEDRQAGLTLLEHADVLGRLVTNEAAYLSISVYFPAAGKQVPVWTLSLRDSRGRDDLAFSFSSITHHLGRDAACAFADALPDVGGLGQKLAVQREKGFTGWPSVSLSALSEQPEALRQVCAAVEQLMDGGEG